jgi:hypothetical protein
MGRVCKLEQNHPSFAKPENDRMIPAKTQHFQAARMGATIRAHAVDHSPMLTAPDVVVDVLLEAIRSTLTASTPEGSGFRLSG